MNKPRILYVYRTRRQNILEGWKKGKNPDSMLFGLNHLRKMGYRVDFFDTAYSLLNPWHWLCWPLEQIVIRQVGMGFKLDQALTLLFRVKSYDVVVLTGDSAGLPFLWLKHLGLVKKPVIFLSAALTGALKAHRQSWVFGFYKQIFQSVDILTVYAKVERDFFIKELKVPTGKVRYIPYGTDWGFFAKRSKRKRTIVAASGVDSSRDYATLFEAIKNLPVKVEVACHPDNVKGLSVPANVKLRFLIDYAKVRDMFQRAAVAVVPLEELGRSAGQMVTLETAAARCPVVVSQIAGITGAYELKEKQHVVYVKPGKVTDLRRKINHLWEHKREALAMGKRASQLVKRYYTSKHLARNVAKLIKELADA